MAAAQQTPQDNKHGIGLIGLIALVISSAIGSGVFALSTDISAVAAPGPAFIAWLVLGAGFICLSFSFGKLSIVRPDLHGLVAYAQEGFGSFVGFISGWGYWLSIWVGCVAFGVMLVTALGYFIPALAGGIGPAGLAIMSAVTWGLILLVNRGVEQAAVVNAVVMACKLVPIFTFIACMAVLFKPAVFTADFWGNLTDNLGGAGAAGTVSQQVVGCFMVMMWVFVGMEGATVLGRRAKRKRDVSRATILGGIALVAIYVAASILPYGYLSRQELMQMGSPSMAYIFQAAVGPWGGAFISGGLVVSILGAWLSYIILSSETLNEMAAVKLLPERFGRLNTYGAPTLCLFVTGAMIQLLSILMVFSQAAYQFAYSLSTASIVVAWALAAAYLAKWGLAQERRPWGTIAVALIACVFLVAAVLLAGADLLMLCAVAYVPGILCYLYAQREQGNPRPLRPWEAVLAALIALIAIGAVILVATGSITI